MWSDAEGYGDDLIVKGAARYPASHTDTSHIATMHPGVGLALAAWLDGTAKHLDWWVSLNRRHVACDCCDNCGRCAEIDLAAPNWSAPALTAVRIADLILGGAS